MNKPTVAQITPSKSHLEEGKPYFWCQCGRSKNQPFCDGSHKGTGFSPVKFEVQQSSDKYLCQCKHTRNPPYCDGTHKQFNEANIGKEGPGVLQQVDKKSQPIAVATPEEPNVAIIHEMAKNGLSSLGHHGPMVAMGVPRTELPQWDDIQIMVAQLATKPLLEEEPVGTGLIIGPEAKRPLELKIPLFVSDMSFGALSEEAKVSLAKGAEIAGTGICSGEGGMLDTEQQQNSRYFYELASAGFGFKEELLEKVQAFHFKGGQGAKTGTGGHLPGTKNIGKIAETRGMTPGTDAISPSTFKQFTTAADFKKFADKVRSISGGIPIGYKLSANHIEKDIQFALDASADYIILDGRGGGTGAAPAIFRDHISVPTIPALIRARRYLDQQGASSRVTLIITGGLRMPMDFVKAMALGADGIAIANSAMQAIGCVGARICNTNNCPSGIATQDPELTARININRSAEQLARYLDTSVSLMQVMSRACGHSHLNQFNFSDLATWHKTMADLTGIQFAGESIL